MVLVIRTVCTASGPRLEMAAVSEAAGQLVMDAAHDMTVFTTVAATVRVVREPLTKGAGAVKDCPELAAPKYPPVPVIPGVLAAAVAVTFSETGGVVARTLLLMVPPGAVATPPRFVADPVSLPADGPGAWAVAPPVPVGYAGMLALVEFSLTFPPGAKAEYDPDGGCSAVTDPVPKAAVEVVFELPPAPNAVDVADGVCSAGEYPAVVLDG